jgi:dihydroorotate dehydrogenase (fumarate)
LSLLERAAGAVSVPVIGSLNGITPGTWARYARSMQDSGAAAVELNIYYLPGDPHICGRDVEQRHLDILARVKDAVTVPVAVKLSPYFSATGEMARRLDEAGADELVLFNRFLQPDINSETLSVVRAVSLSTPAEIRLPLRWIALLRGRVGASLAATTGVESAVELIKYLLAGADAVMTASALLRHGPEHAAVLLDGLCEWMRRKGYTTVEELRGLLATPVGGCSHVGRLVQRRGVGGHGVSRKWAVAWPATRRSEFRTAALCALSGRDHPRRGPVDVATQSSAGFGWH